MENFKEYIEQKLYDSILSGQGILKKGDLSNNLVDKIFDSIVRKVDQKFEFGNIINGHTQEEIIMKLISK